MSYWLAEDISISIMVASPASYILMFVVAYYSIYDIGDKVMPDHLCAMALLRFYLCISLKKQCGSIEPEMYYI